MLNDNMKFWSELGKYFIENDNFVRLRIKNIKTPINNKI